MNSILTVIVTYNAMQWAERCFSSLKDMTIEADVYVIDNGSSDGTQSFIKENYPQVILYESEKNLGFGKANNIGLQYALDNGYDYVYLLNQDAWVFPDTFEQLIGFSKSHPEFGILSPFQMQADMLHVDIFFQGALTASRFGNDIFSALYCGQKEDLYEVDGVMAAHWFMTIECIRKTGGFSPTFPHYGEDDNYLDRLKFLGYKIGVVPSLKVVHDRGNRETPKKKKLHIGYTGMLRELSKPHDDERWSKALYIMIINTMKYKSFRPVIDFFKALANYRTIRNNRKCSARKECAFLNI